MRPVAAILFDAGNTLMHLDYEFIAEVLGRHGYPTTPLAIRIAEYSAKAAIDCELAPEMATPDSVEGLLWPDETGERPSYFAVAMRQLGVPSSSMRPVLDALQAHNRESCLWRVVEPDTPEVLGELRERGFTLAVISNADGRVEDDLGRYGLRPHFATVVDSHVVGVEKPNPEIFRLALERLEVEAEQAVYVGDVFGIDVMGARRAGLQAVLIDTLERYPGKVDCPRIRRLADLLELLVREERGVKRDR